MIVRSADASSARIWCRSQHADEASALLTDSFNRTLRREGDLQAASVEVGFVRLPLRVKKLFYGLAFAFLGFAASAGTLAQFRTTWGDIDVELYDQDKPVTVQNFMRYVKRGVYTNMFLHRCLPGFIVQGGGFSV